MSRVASFTLPATADRASVLSKIVAFAQKLGADKRWRVTIEPYRKARSNAQNNYLHGVPYKLLSEYTGYEHDDIAEFCCGSYFGWKQVKCPRSPNNPRGVRDVPVRTTTTNERGERSVLTTTQFADYVAWIQRFGAEHGVFIPDPNEEVEQLPGEQAA